MKPLLPDLNDPAAIAFSGGGDSTALLHLGASHPQITHAFIVDHGLRAGSDAEVEKAANYARALGYIVQSDRWEHSGITSGIQMKARDYRYAAMGRLCRAAGLKHLITGHTADDQAETLVMRLERKTGWRGLAGMRTSAYAPLWPALMGVTLQRPLLEVSRAELRGYNAKHGLRYVDDPSNENRDFARVRARQFLLADQTLRRELLTQQADVLDRLMAERCAGTEWLSRFANISQHGFVETSSVPSAELLLHILNAVSGKGHPIDMAKRKRLRAAMLESDFSATTLAGAWVLRTSHSYLFTRDMVAVKGRYGLHEVTPLTDITLKAGESCLWDGRFFVKAKQGSLSINPSYGNLKFLSDVIETKGIFDLPAQVRGCLPVYETGGDILGFGHLETAYFKAEPVSAQRLHYL